MQCVSQLHNVLHSFFNNREVNSLTTALMVFVGLYSSIMSIMGQSMLHPMAEEPLSRGDVTITVGAIFALFLLLTASLIAGRIAKFLRLPPLLGSLILGIFIRNVPVFYKFFVIPPHWDMILRKLAFVNILVRWGLATDAKFIREHSTFPLVLGLITPCGEAIALAVSSHFILNVSVPMSCLFGLALAAVSPAVTIPSMIAFRDKQLGSKKNIPENVMAACCFDNLFCTSLSTLLASILFVDAPLVTTTLLNAGTLAFGVFIGFVIGWLLWRFPRADVPYAHFARVLLIGSISTALVIDSYLMLYPCAGLVAGLMLCTMSSARWSVDNEEKTHPIETTYKYIWDVFSSPILFVLLGRKFDCSSLTWEVVFLCLGVIAIGLLTRIVFTLIVTTGSSFKFKEQVVIAMSMLPRATIQADLGPTIVVFASSFPNYISDANMILKACILSILFTAPIGDMLITFIGPRLLSPGEVEDFESKRYPPETGAYVHEISVDNNLDSSFTNYRAYRDKTLIERY